MMPMVDIGDEKPKFVSAHKANRNKYTDLEWLPGQGLDVITEDGIKVMNMHKPYKQGRNGDVSLWVNHVKHYYPEESEIIFDFLAYTLQFPTIKINYCLFMVGKQGIGKNQMFNPMQWALNHEFKPIDASNISSNYNDYLLGTKLLVIDEPRNTNDSRWHMAESLKTLLATANDEQEILINPKYGKQRFQRNLTNTIILSNHADSIRINNERRFFACYSDAPAQHAEYYQKLANCDYAAIVYWLRCRDLNYFNPKQLPTVTSSRERIENEARTELVEDVADFLQKYRAVGFKQVVELAKSHSKAIGEASIKRVIEEAGGKVEPRTKPSGARITRICPVIEGEPEKSGSRIKLVCLSKIPFNEAWNILRTYVQENKDLPTFGWNETF